MSKRFSKDYTGHKFGKLLLLERIKKNDGIYYKCKCDCGNICVRKSSNILGGLQSCGCEHGKNLIEYSTKHGKSNTRLYRVYASMKSRCVNKKELTYKYYGGRGITICDEWKNDFQAFYDWAIANGYDENAPRGKCTLDRIDENGNYEPKNCRWVDMYVQNNNKHFVKWYEYKGEKLPLAELARRCNINRVTLRDRLNKGLSVEEATTMPVKKVGVK